MWETLLNKNRRVKPGGERFDALIPKPKGKRTMVANGMIPENTVALMFETVKETKNQTSALAKHLERATVYETCAAVWQFIFDYILYSEENEEEIKEPSYTWHISRHTGADCDDMALFAASILDNLGISYSFRITKYKKLNGIIGDWQHIYVIVNHNGREIKIDPVLNKFDFELPYHDKKDFMNTYRLSGGFGAATTTSDDEAQLALIAIRDNALKPGFAAQLGYEPSELLQKTNDVLAVWNNEAQRNALLENFSQAEGQNNQLQGLGYDGLGAVKAAPKQAGGAVIVPKTAAPKTAQQKITNIKNAKNVKNVFQTVKAVVKNKVSGIKQKVEEKTGKPLKAVIVHTAAKIPAAVSRAGLHLFLKLNVLGVAEILRWGMLTPQQAQAQKVPMNRYPKAQKAYKDFLKFHYQVGGQDKVLNNLLQKHIGKRADGSRLKGLGELGVEPATTAAAITASLPLIIKGVNILVNAGAVEKPRYKKRLNGLGNPMPVDNGIDFAEMASEVSIDGADTEEKVSFLKQLWQSIKNFIGGKKSIDLSETETFDMENVEVEASAQREVEDPAKGDSGGEQPSTKPDNTLLYIGGVAAAAAAFYFINDKEYSKKQEPLGKAKTGGETKTEKQKRYFAEQKKTQKFKLV